jgi:transposase
MGRPTLLNQKTTKMLIDLIAAGIGQDEAADAAGVGRSTFLGWCARGRAERTRLAEDPKAKPRATEKPFVDLLEAIEKAKAQDEARRVIRLNKNAEDPKNWRIDLEILERRYPQRWSKTNRTEISGPDGGPVRQETTVILSEAEIIALADQLAGLGPVLPPTEETE